MSVPAVNCRRDAARPAAAERDALLSDYQVFCAGLDRGPSAVGLRLRTATAFLAACGDLSAWMTRPLDARLADLRRFHAWPLICYAALTGRLRCDADLLVAQKLGGFGRCAEDLYPADFGALRAAAGRLSWGPQFTEQVIRQGLRRRDRLHRRGPHGTQDRRHRRARRRHRQRPPTSARRNATATSSGCTGYADSSTKPESATLRRPAAAPPAATPTSSNRPSAQPRSRRGDDDLRRTGPPNCARARSPGWPTTWPASVSFSPPSTPRSPALPSLNGPTSSSSASSPVPAPTAAAAPAPTPSGPPPLLPPSPRCAASSRTSPSGTGPRHRPGG